MLPYSRVIAMYFIWCVFGVPARYCNCKGPCMHRNAISSPNSDVIQIPRIREYWKIEREPGFLAVVWFGSSPTLPAPLLSASCLSLYYSKYSCQLPVDLIDRRGAKGRGVGEEPNHTTRKPDSIMIIQYSLPRIIVGYCTYTIPIYRIHHIKCR
jgi:hypothetical protein